MAPAPSIPGAATRASSAARRGGRKPGAFPCERKRGEIVPVGTEAFIRTSRKLARKSDLFSVRIYPLSSERSIQLVNIGVEYAVDEADAGRFVGILVWQLDMDLP